MSIFFFLFGFKGGDKQPFAGYSLNLPYQKQHIKHKS